MWRNLTAWQNFFSLSRQTWKWRKKLFFHLLDLTILNSFIILASCGSRLSHRQFRLTLLRDLCAYVPRPQTARDRRQARFKSQLKRLDSRHNRHWLTQFKRIKCCVCYAKNKETRTKHKCWECNIGLCATPLKYNIPNCISENQVTLKWKSQTHICK